MYKNNSKVIIENKELTIKQLRKSKKGLKRFRAKRLYHMDYMAEIDGIKVKPTFIAKVCAFVWMHKRPMKIIK